MMKKVPKRRFKGFLNAGDWEQRKLGELVTVFSGQDYKHLSEGDIPVYGTGGYMLSVNEALSNDQDAIGIGRKGTIDKPYILKAPFWTVDTLFYAIPKEKMDLNFIFCIFKNVDWRKLDESTGVPSLSKSTITNVDVYCPFFEEQLLIGRFFSWIDSSITLHQRKLEKLQATKKALLYELFPIENSRRPKRRFKGFTGDWEQRKLGDLTPLRGGFAFKSTEFKETGVPVIRISNILSDGSIGGDFAYYLEQNNDENYVLPNNALVIAMSGATTGKAAVLKNTGNIKFYQNQRVGYFQNNLKCDYSFISTLVKSSIFLKQLESVLVAGAQPNISSKEIDSFIFKIPISTDEQRKISKLFNMIDSTITLHQRKLEKLKNLKAAYLNEMFV